jgi:hypothetical protein
LPLGVRRLPTPYDLGLQPSATWASSHTSTGLKEPRLTANGAGVLLRDSWFATGLPTTEFSGASQATPPVTTMPDPIALPLTVQESEAWFTTSLRAVKTSLACRGDPNSGMLSRVQNLLQDSLVDRLAQDLVR